MFLLNRYWFLHSDISNLYFKNEVKIIKYTKGLIFSLFLLSTFILGCKDKGAETVIEPPKLESLGLEGKIVNKLDYVEPYLYVSAASEGLWRRNVLSLTEWEYLGLADTSLGRYNNVGVMDFDIKGNDILVAYSGSAPHIKPESTVGIWHSTNAGKSWFRSDSGIPETITDPYESNDIHALQRSPHKPEIAIAVIGPAHYRSTDSGYTWKMISGMRGVFCNEDHIRWHPYRPGEAWGFGLSSVFEAYCGCAQDYYTKGKVGVDIIALGLASGTLINDITFDSGNPDVIYISTSSIKGGVMKSTDGGFTWQLNAFNIPDDGYIVRMLSHPNKANCVFMTGREYLYYTLNGGNNIKILYTLEGDVFNWMAFDGKNERLFIAAVKKGICVISTLSVDK